MSYIIPEALQKGDTIGLIAPSSPVLVGRLENGIAFLEKKGFKVKLGKHIHDSVRFLAGKDKDRAQDIMDFFQDPDIKAMISICGGYGTQRLLPYLDYDVIRKHPKIVVGFSDSTGLQLALLKKAGLVSYSGFMLADTQEDGNPRSVDPLIESSLMACLTGKSYSITEGEIAKPGIVKGQLIGGNSDLIVALLGTPYEPNFKDCILLIEEVRIEPYKVDAMLSHLFLMGIFDKVAGVIFGQFENCIAKNFPLRDGTVQDVIDEWSDIMPVPCLKYFPYGHGKRRCVLPIGKHIVLNVDHRTLKIP